jgi:hypothetical protein
MYRNPPPVGAGNAGNRMNLSDFFLGISNPVFLIINNDKSGTVFPSDPLIKKFISV